LAKLKHLLTEWGKTLGEDGYGFYSARCGGPHYTYEKLVCGLVDCYVYAGLDEAKPLLERLTDWAAANLDRTRNAASPTNCVGTAPFEESGDFLGEWYTLSENLYRAYLATGEAKYREFCYLWRYDLFRKRLAANHNHAFKGLHAYSHINSLSSAAMSYEVTGDEEYLAAMRNGYDILRGYHMLMCGLSGPNEIFTATGNGALGESLKEDRAAFEGPCNVWAGFKLSRYLMTMTGDARYGDWTESLTYNTMLACMPMKDDEVRRGNTDYHTDYAVKGAMRSYHCDGFTCCSGTYPQAVTDYHNVIYYRDNEALYVNLFVPSRVKYPLHSGAVTITQKTRYPLGEKTSLRFSSGRDAEFTVKVRVPGWVKPDTMVFTLNGSRIEVPSQPGSWAAVSRKWSNGDVLSIRIPFSLRFVPVDSVNTRWAALMFGPLLMAIPGDFSGPLDGDIKHPENWLATVEGEPFHFHATNQPKGEITFKPFFEIRDHVPYHVYNEVVHGEPAGA